MVVIYLRISIWNWQGHDRLKYVALMVSLHVYTISKRALRRVTLEVPYDLGDCSSLTIIN